MQDITPYLRTTHRRHVFISYLEASLASNSFLKEGIPDDFEVIANKAGFSSIVNLSDSSIGILKANLLQAPVVRLVCTYILDDAFIEKIYPYIFSSASPGLLDLEVSSTISGGFILYRDGVKYDYSFTKHINELFSDTTFINKLSAYL